MAFFSTPDTPPTEEEGALAYVLWIAQEWHGIPEATARSTFKQELGIYGDDVDEFALKLAERYGEWVAEWPWHRFTELSEGVPLTWPFRMLWQLASWPFRGRFSYPEPHERLELGHIARVLEAGEWIEP